MRSTFAPPSTPDRVNNTFNVGAKKFGTMRENFQAVLDRAGHGKHVVSLPAAPAIWILKFLEQVHVSPIYKWIYDTAAEESFVSIERLEENSRFHAAVLKPGSAGSQLRLVRGPSG